MLFLFFFAGVNEKLAVTKRYKREVALEVGRLVKAEQLLNHFPSQSNRDIRRKLMSSAVMKLPVQILLTIFRPKIICLFLS